MDDSTKRVSSCNLNDMLIPRVYSATYIFVDVGCSGFMVHFGLNYALFTCFILSTGDTILLSLNSIVFLK